MSSHPWSPTSQLLAAGALLCVISSWVATLIDEYKSLCRVVGAGGFLADGCMDSVQQRDDAQSRHSWGACAVSTEGAGWPCPPGGPSPLEQTDLQVSHRNSHPICAPKMLSEQTSDFNSHTLLKHHKGCLILNICNMKPDIKETYMYVFLRSWCSLTVFCSNLDFYTKQISELGNKLGNQQ